MTRMSLGKKREIGSQKKEREEQLISRDPGEKRVGEKGARGNERSSAERKGRLQKRMKRRSDKRSKREEKPGQPNVWIPQCIGKRIRRETQKRGGNLGKREEETKRKGDGKKKILHLGKQGKRFRICK